MKKAKKAGKKHPGDRPRKYTLLQAQQLGEDYFKSCDANKKPYTICGLARALGV